MKQFSQYFKTILLILAIFMSSCSKPPDLDVQSPTSSLTKQDGVKLSNQIKYLVKDSSIISIADTNSMIPVLDNNSIVLIEKIPDIQCLKIGDIIVYRNSDINSKYCNQLIIHTVVSMDKNIKTLTTKGYNNLTTDPEIQYSNIVGRVFCVIYTK